LQAARRDLAQAAVAAIQVALVAPLEATLADMVVVVAVPAPAAPARTALLSWSIKVHQQEVASLSSVLLWRRSSENADSLISTDWNSRG